MAQKDDLTVCVWQDSQAVMVLSNYHDPTERGSVKRGKQECNQSGGSTASLPFRPPKTHEWCGCAGSDGWYQYQHRSKKWWRRLFFFFLLAIRSYNAYIAARCAGGKTFLAKYKSGYKGWLEDLVKELVTPVTARRAPPFCLLFCLLID